MNYSLENILKKYGIKAQKKLGQNWLIDQNIIKKILKIAKIQNEDVIEIGPGLGALTHLLINSAKSILAYEIDPVAIAILKQEINQKNITIVHQDFLKASFDWEIPRVIIGNIPYYITTDIIFKILKHQKQFSRVILTVQDEVANRLIAPVGSKNYSKLTVCLNFLTVVKKHFVIKKTHFYPTPSVDSALISLELKHHLNQQQTQAFLNFVKQCFAFRRKTLMNNLLILINDRKVLEQTFNQLNLGLKIRPQELSSQKFFDLFKILQVNHAKK